MTEATLVSPEEAQAGNFFAGLEPTPAEHFKAHFLGALLRLINEVAGCFDSMEEALKRFPFLASYAQGLAEYVDGLSLEEALIQWWASLDRWEQTIPGHLPLRALRETC